MKRALERRRLVIISPSPPGSTSGNSVTADRYARIFRSLGWKVRILAEYGGEPANVLVGLHARKSAASVLSFRTLHPNGSIILVLTGTDLYRDIARSRAAANALDAADHLVVLQPDGLRHLPKRLRAKASAVVQSATPCVPRPRRRSALFTICVLGHLRPEKDPMRAALALRTLDGALPLRLVHAGAILSAKYERATDAETVRNPRYRFLEEISRAKARGVLCRSDLLVQSSRMEGGANAVSEALACGVPILASRISGNVGILGRSYPGLYPAGDTLALAHLIERAYMSPAFYKTLLRSCAKVRPLVSLASEQKGWREVFGSIP